MLVNNAWMVVLTILKNMKVNGKDYPGIFIANLRCPAKIKFFAG